MPDIRPYVEEPRRYPSGASGRIAAAAERLPDLDDPAFGKLFNRFGDSRVVLLGEASHGTSEFYRARAAITRWLVEKRDFNVVALEADWPDARVLDGRVRGRRTAAGEAFTRFPAWMWKNREFDDFLRWLAEFNAGRPQTDQAGVYGLDLYNLAGSMRAVVDYLDRVDPEGREGRPRALRLLEPLGAGAAGLWADGRLGTVRGL